MKPAIKRASTTHSKIWCGPYAIATILNITYDAAYYSALRWASKMRGHNKTSVSGISDEEFDKIVEDYGYNIEWVPVGDFYTETRNGVRRMKLRKHTLREHLEYLKPGRIYVIRLSFHYVVVDTTDWSIIDNQNFFWQNVLISKHLRKKVNCIADVTDIYRDRNRRVA